MVIRKYKVENWKEGGIRNKEEMKKEELFFSWPHVSYYKIYKGNSAICVFILNLL